jgi:monofunctional biosynthetic peptidoglycan transglycosylase
MPKAKKSRSARPLRWILIALGVLLLMPPVEVLAVRFIDPPRTRPMLLHQIGGALSRASSRPLLYRWVDLPRVPETFLKHVWISEDQRFFQHDGFDWKEIDIAMERAERRGTPVRGASTITMQCARSIFLWQGRSWIRKGIEAYYTFWMETLLSKRRIMELYVNVIELGRGIYGIEAGAQHHFGVSAARLTREQSALLAAVLPNPKGWNPAKPSVKLRLRQQRILHRERSVNFPQHLVR